MSAAASTVTYATTGARPRLLVHGDDDASSPSAKAGNCTTVSPRRALPCTCGSFLGTDHCFLGADLGPPVRDGLDFLNRALQP